MYLDLCVNYVSCTWVCVHFIVCGINIVRSCSTPSFSSPTNSAMSYPGQLSLASIWGKTTTGIVIKINAIKRSLYWPAPYPSKVRCTLTIFGKSSSLKILTEQQILYRKTNHSLSNVVAIDVIACVFRDYNVAVFFNFCCFRALAYTT